MTDGLTTATRRILWHGSHGSINHRTSERTLSPPLAQFMEPEINSDAPPSPSHFSKTLAVFVVVRPFEMPK